MELTSSRWLAPVALATWFASGCGADPVSYSAPVGINLKATGEGARSGVITDQKNVQTESGNPYGAFVGAARDQLGRDPSHIEVSRATLMLGGASEGVTALDQVVAGRLDLQFLMNDTDNSYNVAHVENATGGGPVTLVVDFRPEAVSVADQAKLIGGGFAIVLRSAAAPGFAGRKALKADLQVTLEFAAYE